MIQQTFFSMILVSSAFLWLTACSQPGDLTVGKPKINADGSESEWRLVSSKRGRFNLEMPGLPKQATNIVSTPVVNIEQYSMMVELSGTTAYGILYFDLPAPLDKAKFPMFMDLTRKRLIGDDDKLVSQREFKLNGCDVTEMVIEKFNGQARATVQTFFVSNRNYTLIVVMPNKIFVSPKDPSSPVIASNLMAHFFNSIEFQK